MGLKSYFAPAKAQAKDEKKHATPEIQEKPSQSSGIPSTHSASNLNSPATGSPWGSRPVSLYPNAEFKSSVSEDLNDIKCDVMVNWLYQQQMERLWTAGGHDEGVALKKGRGAYACCPSSIVDEPYGFFKAVETLNVRARAILRSSLALR